MKTKEDFNTYKEGLDLEFLRRYRMEHREERTLLRGERLRVLERVKRHSRAGELARIV